MQNPAQFIFLSVLIAGCAAAGAQARADAKTPGGSALEEHYNAAQQFQKSGKLDRAADEFRAFLAEGLGELAIGHARSGDYPKAMPLFEEALALVPDSPELRLEYARTALLANDFPHAQSLAEAYLREEHGAPQSLAQAHQILGRALLKMNHDQEARKELEIAVALDPNFENGYDLAVACLDLDDEKCAVQLFGEMQASFGDTPSIHIAFGRAYGNSDFAPRAVAEFKKAIAEDPRLPTAHYCLAAALLATGQDETTMGQAETELKKELEISPRDFLTYAALGKLAATHNQYPEAERYLKRATLLDPTNPDAFLYLGQMYYDTNRPDDAEAALRRAIELTSDVARNRYQIQKAHFLLGRILMQRHREADARAEMQIARALTNKVLSQDKSELAGLLANSAATTGSAGNSPEPVTAEAADHKTADLAARDELARFEKQLTPAIADSYNNLGAIAAAASDYDDALRYFEHAAERTPALDGLDYNWGRAAFMASRFSEAIGPLSRYISAHPGDSGSRAALAMSEFMTQGYLECLKTLDGVDETIGSIPQMQYIYADSLVKTGRVSDGRERLESLEAKHPEIPEVHRGLGEALELQGERDKAVRELQAALQLNARDPETHYDLGKAELESGNAAGAIAELQSAVQLKPRDARFHQELANAYKLDRRTAEAEKELKVFDELQKSQAPAGGVAADDKKSP
jgi:tetratricopeptide (TPR) repeat protein